MVKCKIVYFRYIRTLWCHTGVIFIKHHMEWLCQHCVHINCPNLCLHNINVCFIVVHNVHVLIYQVSNNISITQTYVLQFILMFIKKSHAVWCITDAHQMEKMSILFECSTTLSKCKTMHKKINSNDGDIYIWLSNKFINSRNTKSSISLTIFTNHRD